MSLLRYISTDGVATALRSKLRFFVSILKLNDANYKFMNQLCHKLIFRNLKMNFKIRQNLLYSRMYLSQ